MPSSPRLKAAELDHAGQWMWQNRSGATGSPSCPVGLVPSSQLRCTSNGKWTASREGGSRVAGLRERGIFSHSVTGTRMER